MSQTHKMTIEDRKTLCFANFCTSSLSLLQLGALASTGKFLASSTPALVVANPWLIAPLALMTWGTGGALLALHKAKRAERQGNNKESIHHIQRGNKYIKPIALGGLTQLGAAAILAPATLWFAAASAGLGVATAAMGVFTAMSFGGPHNVDFKGIGPLLYAVPKKQKKHVLKQSSGPTNRPS